MRFDAVYDKKLLTLGLLGLGLLCLAMKVTGGAGFLLIFPLVFMGFSKNKTELLLWCILATTALTGANDIIAPKDSVFTIANRVLYLLVATVMVLQVLGSRSSKVLSPLLGLLPYLLYMGLVSYFGWMPLISYLKLALFTMVYLAFYSVGAATVQGNTITSQQLRSILLCFSCFFIIGSILLIPFPGISLLRVEAFFQMYGYYPEEGLFRGITLHSQALGPLVAIYSVILLADLLFSIRRWDKLYVCLLLLTPILVYKSGSRTAMGTYLAGICVVSFVFMHARGLGVQWKGKVLSILFLIGLVGGCAFMATPSLRQSAVQFIFKTRGAEVAKESRTFENFTSSRQGLVDRAMKNFRESPWIGNGFQVSEMQKDMRINSWKQLLTAPIEKGVWFAAVLEEGGIFGMILMCIFWLFTFIMLLQRHAFIGASGLFVLFVSNFGEFTMFSMSGTGGLLWAMIFMGLTMDAVRLKQEAQFRYLVFTSQIPADNPSNQFSLLMQSYRPY